MCCVTQLDFLNLIFRKRSYILHHVTFCPSNWRSMVSHRTCCSFRWRASSPLVSILHLAVPWLRQLVGGLSPEVQVHIWVSPCGICGWQSSIGTGFSLSFLVFPYQYHFPLTLHTDISSGGWRIGPLVATVQRYSLTPLTWITTVSILHRSQSLQSR
jgi:hypothetical protein